MIIKISLYKVTQWRASRHTLAVKYLFYKWALRKARITFHASSHCTSLHYAAKIIWQHKLKKELQRDPNSRKQYSQVCFQVHIGHVYMFYFSLKNIKTCQIGFYHSVPSWSQISETYQPAIHLESSFFFCGMFHLSCRFR